MEGLQVIGISYPERGHTLGFAEKMAKAAGIRSGAHPSDSALP